MSTSAGTSSTQSSPDVKTRNSMFKRSGPPNPAWTWGQRVQSTPEGKEWIDGEKTGWTTIDASVPDPKQMYALLGSGIVPRPVAFVSSISEDGTCNLAPFSWFNQVSTIPPVISVSVTKGSPAQPVKDTAKNIQTTKGFVVHIISEPWLMQANACGIDAPADVSEWDLSGLTKIPSNYVKAPRVLESAFSMECEFLQAIDIHEPGTSNVATTLILGTIKCIHARNDCLDDKGVFDPEKLKPIARLGRIAFTKVTETIDIVRPGWKKNEEAIREHLKREETKRGEVV